jgi:hypothetical protein
MCLVLRWIPDCAFASASDYQQRRDEVDDVSWGNRRLGDHGRTRNDRCACWLTVHPSILLLAIRLETFAGRHLVGGDCNHRVVVPCVWK